MGKAKDEFRLKVVREALSGIKVGVLARSYDLHPETIRTWIRTYRDQITDIETSLPDQHLQELKRLQEIEEKYEKAMKVLGEKELENEILRELVKKKNPAYLKNLK
ncbi:transposase [Paenibacillus sp. M1]|uniref:Transposase n=1 Tax=Paenibacillus haidiansis TaxID=1574488 RepID=A0ABU7VYD3_9BACL